MHDWLPALIPVALAVIGGAIEMRVAVGRLETKLDGTMAETERRLEKIEQVLEMQR